MSLPWLCRPCGLLFPRLRGLELHERFDPPHAPPGADLASLEAMLVRVSEALRLGARQGHAVVLLELRDAETILLLAEEAALP